MRFTTAFRAIAAAAAIALTASACSADGGGDGDTIRIGASLPLTGEFSQGGLDTQRGYETWVEMTNEAGGLLGKPVEIIVKDDATQQETAVSNYNNLIAQDKVDLLLGSQSSLLNIPASAIAEKNKMLFVCPSCGSPDMFNRGFSYIFFSQQAIATDQAKVFAEWIAALPPEQRPKTAAYNAYFEQNPQVRDDLAAIHQPVSALSEQCGFDVAPTLVAAAVWQTQPQTAAGVDTPNLNQNQEGTPAGVEPPS